MTSSRSEVRLAELIAAISLATDLGTGQPMEHALRSCYLATAFARELGLPAQDLFDTYYVSLLRFLGCTAEASPDAEFNAGDDIALYEGLAPSFMGRQSEAITWMLRHLAEGSSFSTRARALVGAFTDPKGAERTIRAHCEVGEMLARRIGLGDSVLHGLLSAFERWDGKGLPNGIADEAIPVSSRIAIVARDFELLTRMLGPDQASEVVKARSGKAFDPRVVQTALEIGFRTMSEIEKGPLWEAVLEAEPGPHLMIEEPRIDDVLRAFGHFVDLKSPFLHGHSTGVAELAAAAAVSNQASGSDPKTIRRAGLVHDLGRVAVPSGIWNAARSLSEGEWERVRLHPYYTERILARCAPLRDLAEVAGSHHERLDGSGYHRGAGARALPPPARLLAAADVFQALTEERPHRPAKSRDEAAADLERACAEGRMDVPCARAVLDAAGEVRRVPPSAWPAGLTDREVDVLRLVASGLSNKQIAGRLTLSPKTVGHHVEHVYSKIGVSTRAGAALFAMDEGLTGG
ncbi:MAG TPA: HD domain-containing phosphohydrolase [Actinomycetota bacterium]|nr:HD domain-containing phosphohydrolase [Actinomycetota bacterium]